MPLQGSTITIKLQYVITYLCQNFGIHDVHGQIPNAFIRRHTFYLVIFLTIFLALGPIQMELKIANLGKTNIDISFKKIHALTHRIYF